MARNNNRRQAIIQRRNATSDAFAREFAMAESAIAPPNPVQVPARFDNANTAGLETIEYATRGGNGFFVAASGNDVSAPVNEAATPNNSSEGVVAEAAQVNEGEERHGDDVNEIMMNVVAKSSLTNYASKNVDLLMWLYADARRHYLLEPWYLNHVEGLSDKERSSTTKEILLSMNARDNNCPVHLDLLSFAKFSDYLATKKLRRAGNNRKRGDNPSKSLYESCRSALMHMFRMSSYTPSDYFLKNIKQFMSGIKRKASLHFCVNIVFFIHFIFKFV